MKKGKDKNYAKAFNPIRQSWVLIVLIIAVFPITWLAVDGLDWLTRIGVMNFISQEPSAWTNAFLGYFASAFAATAGYFAVLITIYKQEESRREDKRKEVLPLIEVNKNSSSTDAGMLHIITNGDAEKVNLNPSNGALFNLKNVGMREMYNVAITDISCDLLDNQIQEIQISPIIYKGSSITARLQPIIIGDFSEKQTIDPIKKNGQITLDPRIPTHFTINVSYQDCYNNQYKQKIKIETLVRANLLESKDDKNITYDDTTIKNIEILSAPELITDKKD